MWTLKGDATFVIVSHCLYRVSHFYGTTRSLICANHIIKI